MEKMSRRNFVGQNAVGAVSLYALTGSALVAAGQKAPRLERMSVANIGQDLQQFVPRMMQHVGVPGLAEDLAQPRCLIVTEPRSLLAHLLNRFVP